MWEAHYQALVGPFCAYKCPYQDTFGLQQGRDSNRAAAAVENGTLRLATTWYIKLVASQRERPIGGCRSADGKRNLMHYQHTTPADHSLIEPGTYGN
jgi:hypothetical protein